MQIEQANEKLIELKNLSKLLPLKGISAIVKWCEKVGIQIEMLGNKRVVNRFMVEMELDKGLISQLKKKYPRRWEALYSCYQENDRLGYLHLLEENSNLRQHSSGIAKKTKSKSNRVERFENS